MRAKEVNSVNFNENSGPTRFFGKGRTLISHAIISSSFKLLSQAQTRVRCGYCYALLRDAFNNAGAVENWSFSLNEPQEQNRSTKAWRGSANGSIKYTLL